MDDLISKVDFAVKINDCEMVKKLLARPTNVIALAKMKIEYKKKFEDLLFKATPEMKTALSTGLRYVRTPLDEAIIMNKDISVIKTLLREGVSVNQKDYNNNAPLHYAILINPLNIVQELLNHGADINSRNREGKTVLHSAIINKKDISVINMLLKAGAKVDVRDNKRNTPLHCEVLDRCDLDVVQELLNHGADPNSRDMQEKTVLHTAIINKKDISVIKVLLKAGAKVDVRDSKGITPLLYEVLNRCDLDIVQELLNNGADPNSKDDDGYTVLHNAVGICRDVSVIKALLEAGALANAQDYMGVTPLHLLASCGPKMNLVLGWVDHGSNCIPGNGNKSPHLTIGMYALNCAKLFIKATIIKNIGVNKDDVRKMLYIETPYTSYDEKFLNYIDICLSEIDIMKTHTIGGNHTIYKLILEMKPIFEIDEKFKETIENTYPVYHDVITKKIDLCLERGRLLDLLSTVQIKAKFEPSTIQGDQNLKVVLNPFCALHLAKYLTNSELQNLILAFEEAPKLCSENVKD